ncbi:MAG: hypothetical protein WBR13_01815 [Allosphingosinicella sp.]
MTEIRPFTAVAVDSELNLLSRLHSMLESDQIGSRDQFGDLMKAAFEHCRLDPRALSDDMGYSFSTIYRWIDGRTAPHPSLWPRITAWIVDAIKARIDTARQSELVEA